jgi:hypothetical protein
VSVATHWADRLNAAYHRTCADFWPKAGDTLVMGKKYFIFDEVEIAGQRQYRATFCTYLGEVGGSARWARGHVGSGASRFLAFLHMAEQEPFVARHFLGTLRQEASR